MNSSQEPDESQASQKPTIERLSKEELIKKYKQAILIAQKAKESKGEFLKHIAQHEELLRSLEEKLQKCEEEKKMETQLRVIAEKKLETELTRMRDELYSATKMKEEFQSTVDTKEAENAKLQQEINEKNGEIGMKEDSVRKLSSELKEIREKFARSNVLSSESSSEIQKLQSENSSISEKILSLETENAELAELVKELNKRLNDLKVEAENRDGIEMCKTCQMKKEQKEEQDIETNNSFLTIQEDMKKQEKCIAKLRLNLEEFQKELDEKDVSIGINKHIIDELRDQVATCKKEEKTFNETIDKLSSENASLERDNVKKDEEIDFQRESISKMSSELSSVKNELEQLKISLYDTSIKVNELQLENDTFAQKMSTIESGKEVLNTEISEKNEEVIKLKEYISDLNSQICDLQRKLSEHESHGTGQASDQGGKTAEEVNKLKSEILLKEGEINEKERIMSEVLQELSEVKNTLTCVENEKKDMVLKLREAKGSLEQKEEEISQYKTYWAEKEVVIPQISEELSNLQNSSKRLENEKTDLLLKLEELSVIKNNLQAIEQEKADLLQQLQEAKENLEQKKKEISQHKIICAEKEGSISLVSKELSEMQNSFKILENERVVMLQELEELSEIKNNLQAIEKEKADLLQQLQEAEENLEQKKKEISQCEINCAQKETFISQVTKELSDMEKSLKCVENEKADMLQQLKELSDVKNNLKCLENENSHLLQQLEEMKETVEQKEKEIMQYGTSSAQTQNDMRQQLNTLQDALHAKELLAQDLEQELSRLKDAVAHESTNTEVSSTFSLSRAEEMNRMKDLEDSFEDKYTKLRVVAVKLKKRVTELTQTLENERSKMATEKSDLQGKLNQLASQAKTVQTLQSEVDRLQDLLEEQKKVQQQLSKDLEAAVKDAASKKFELASVQEDFTRLAHEKKSLEASMSSMESFVSQRNALQTEIEKLCKELKEKDIVLDTCKEENLKLAEQLEKVCVDSKKRTVLSLEMADMEKSVSELTRQLSAEREQLKKTENELEQERYSHLALQDTLKNVEDNLKEKEEAYQELKNSLSLAKDEAKKLHSQFKEKEMLAEQLSSQLEKQRSLVEELNIQCSNLAAEQVRTKENARIQIEALNRQVFKLEEQCSQLGNSHKSLEDELLSVRTEFENYKVRAQSVLRQSAKQEDRSVSSSTVHNAEELEVEVERLRVNVSSLKENLQKVTSQLQAALQEVGIEREDKLRAIKQAQSSKDACSQAIERQHAAEERLSVVLEESKQAKLHSDMLVQCYKQQLEDFKATHQKKVASLTEQLETLQASITYPTTAPTDGDRDRPFSAQSGPSPVADWANQLSNASQSDIDLAMRLSSLQREEGEGSESVDSFPSRRISVASQERRHELVPLDKLLSSPSYPEDDSGDVARANSSDLSVDLLQSKLSACESRAAHLTALLSEAESDAARLSQLNDVLKEEIRRQQRCEERAQHAHNLEYLKNVVVKFVTLQSGDERQRLVPVLNTILKLSPEEASLVETAAKGASQANTSSGWGSYLPLPSWTGS